MLKLSWTQSRSWIFHRKLEQNSFSYLVLQFSINNGFVISHLMDFSTVLGFLIILLLITIILCKAPKLAFSSMGFGTVCYITHTQNSTWNWMILSCPRKKQSNFFFHFEKKHCQKEWEINYTSIPLIPKWIYSYLGIDIASAT